jgi:hypothetical protein
MGIDVSERGKMKGQNQGFSGLHFVLIIAAVAIIGAVGYGVYQRNNKPVSTTVTVNKTTTVTGPTSAVDTSNTQEVSSESSTDNQYTSADQSAASSTNQAATNLGGAYNASSN